ncbi:MAG: putative molybdenum carrier protein [Deltaproteobacteria bacterium]|nr:putative molybdenum carrier protein [Deltaproteobacteria bacterium]
MSCPNIFEHVEIISGGQTGADRAALDFALQHNIRHGGYCPRGRRAEDGVLSACYLLKETECKNYEKRTMLNVQHADGTVIFSIRKKLDGGTLFTFDYARELHKPLLHLAQSDLGRPAVRLRNFLRKNGISRLNVAGPRASKEPGVYAFVMRVLTRVFKVNSI